jgi:hypothetical protein
VRRPRWRSETQSDRAALRASSPTERQRLQRPTRAATVEVHAAPRDAIAYPWLWCGDKSTKLNSKIGRGIDFPGAEAAKTTQTDRRSRGESFQGSECALGCERVILLFVLPSPTMSRTAAHRDADIAHLDLREAHSVQGGSFLLSFLQFVSRLSALGIV